MPELRFLLPLALGTLLALLPAPAHAHEVETADGTVHEGRIVVQDEEEVIIVTTFDGRKRIPRADVTRIDDRTPPLRDQLRHRAERAMDSVSELFKLHKWAKKKGFERELEQILQRVIALDAGNVRAHKLLGHEKVDGTWMTPDQKARHELEKQREAMQAKGFVEYEGRWVTPEEKDALERGLVKDGDAWVTEEEYHRRRGEHLRDGEWVRIGQDEGRAWRDWLKKSRVAVGYLWGPNVDFYADLGEDDAREVHEGCEKIFQAFFRVFAPDAEEMPKGVQGRARIHVFAKQPAYARFVKAFDRKEQCSDLVRGWAARAQRQHAFWWVQPIGVVGAYKFPNTTRTVTSNAGHHLGFLLLTQYRFNFRFPQAWLKEGVAYFLELEAYGYSDTFNVHRGGTAAAASSGTPAWLDSGKWKGALRAQVDQGLDPPLARMVRMEEDQLGYVELVKCWSVVDFLIREDIEKFRAFIDADKDREISHAQALKDVYGWTWRQLDQAWRAHVQETYPSLAPEAEE